MSEFDTGKPQGNRHPVKDVTFTLKDVLRDERTYGTTKRTNAKIQGTDIEVHETYENQVWAHPIIEFSVPYTDPSGSSGNTRWEALASSLRKIAGEGATLSSLKGKRLRMAQIPFSIRQNTAPEGEPDKWENKDADCWQFVEIEGVGSRAEANGNIRDYILDTADGKTEADAKAALMSDMSKLAGHSEITNGLTEGTLFSTYVSSQLLTKDDAGVLHKA